ncbi:unnamed protein product [Mycena citricolor]|uniref:Polyprotein n=1 Tax=Mycena citricolor TaxID=2018698 RepID=A0AAD2HFH0_9AGAR|nr:unnamed protein product [Mycena citricolor]
MTTNLPATPLLPDEQKLATDGANWANFEEIMISMARGRGVDGYLFGTVLNPTAFVASSAGYTPLNATTPSPDEYMLRDGWVAAMLYQNIKDPRSHDLKGSDSANLIWTTLVSKFNRSTELLVGLKMERLHTLELKDPRYLMSHIDELVKRRAEVHDIGGSVPDPLMCTIILSSLPKEEFRTSLIALQIHKVVAHIVQHLREWWDLVWKKRVEEEGASANALGAVTNDSLCENCGVSGHNQRACWARGGGKEGQAPGWWKPPRGKEPALGLVQAHRQARENRRNHAQPYVNHQIAAAQAPESPPTTAYASPMATYVLAAETHDDGMSSGLGEPYRTSNKPFRMGRGRSHPTVLNGEFGQEGEPVVYATSAVQSKANQIPTFLDSGVSEHCIVDRAKFVTYHETAGVQGQTAVKSGGQFRIAGHGEAEIIVRLERGQVHRLRFHTLHTPDFRMNLLSITTLDARGLKGSWGNGTLSVVNRQGVEVLTGRIASGSGSGRKLYAVDVVDEKLVAPTTVAITGRNRKQPTSMENWHRQLGHADIRMIQRMATRGFVEGLDITKGEVRGMCQDCILGKQDRAPFDDEVVHENNALERVHLDLWGRARTPSWGGAVYLLLISDGGTSMKFPVFLADKRKETVLKAFAAWVTEAEVQTERKLKVVRVDLGSDVCWVKDLDEREGKLGRQGWEGQMVFEVRNVIFEEGEAHRTSGAEPTSDNTNVMSTDEDRIAEQPTGEGEDGPPNMSDTVPEQDAANGQTNKHDSITNVPPIPRKTSRIPKPSRKMLESRIARREEAEARRANEDWARDSIRPSVNFVDLEGDTFDEDSFTTPMALASATRGRLPRSGAEALKEPEIWGEPMKEEIWKATPEEPSGQASAGPASGDIGGKDQCPTGKRGGADERKGIWYEPVRQ